MLTKKTDKINIWRRDIVQGCSLVETLFRLFLKKYLIHNKRRPKHVNERPLNVWLRNSLNSFRRICITGTTVIIL